MDRSSSEAREDLSRLSIAHGLYYAITGFWPLVSIGTFQLVTGRKRDIWLVKTAGTLIGVIGCVLTVAGFRRRLTPEITALGIGSSLGLAAIDVVYVRKRVIRPIYLLDALLELGLVAGWIRFSLFALRRS